jgi:hypothetical protein
MKQQKLTPAILGNNPRLLDFISEMTLDEYVTQTVSPKLKEYAFFFSGKLCHLSYDPNDNWIKLYVSSTTANRAELYESFEQWAQPDLSEYVLQLEDSPSKDIWRFFKKPEEPKPFYLPIDNKHILEDFTHDFHNGDFIETVEFGKHIQVFVSHNCICTISYTFGTPWFYLEIVDGHPQRREDVSKHWKNIIENYNRVEDGEGTYVKRSASGGYAFVLIEK